MSSPAAHGIIGLAIGMARFLPRAGNLRSLARAAWDKRIPLFICILLANAPDIDYLFGIPRGDLNIYHHTVTHTAAWALLLASALWAAGWPDRSLRSFLFILLLPGSHLAADFLTEHGPGSHGMMIGWPFSTHTWISPVSLFPRPAKGGLAELLSLHNLRVIAVDILITLPLVAAVALFKIHSAKIS